MEESTEHVHPAPWNKGVIVGQKTPFKLKEIWAIRVRLQLQHRVRELGKRGFIHQICQPAQAPKRYWTVTQTAERR